MDEEGTIATSRSNAGSHPLAMTTSSLLWGCVAFAGCLALGWGSLLRPAVLRMLLHGVRMLLRDTLLWTLLCEDVAARDAVADAAL